MTKEPKTLTVWCPVCDAPQRHILLLTGIKGYGNIYRCVNCQLTRLLPLPTVHEHEVNTKGMYEEQTIMYDYDKARLAARSVEGYLRVIHSMGRKPLNLLDVGGGGLGYYSRAFANSGLLVTYKDMDPISIEFTRFHNQKAGIEIIPMSIEDFCGKTNKKYDVIFFRHVIEHCLEDSFKNLRRIRPLAIDKDQTHYYSFRAGNLTKLLARTGWYAEKCFDYSFGDPIYWPNIIYSLLYPIFRIKKMGAGLAVYATLRD